ncbi:sigma-70 family RNA polymerase sigma factor, partial [Candidatus Poribacteria bacterium]|nr:sigma-70 family RNA polymerase sigma factor [Candidatus Poribacteria bacterium]
MKKQDVQLIQRILDGDQKAFTAIVEKYQKGIHTLAWQKTGDFHIAQEITQDTFLKAYQQLGTLKNRKLFCGWLYVIATNLCNDWLRKKRLPIQSLETVDIKEVDQVAYTNYIEEQTEEDANESRRELVGNLLKKLPESERTVMSLHYLGEMSCESIGEFLGVSQNTVKSRLSRARNRLKKEESMLRENLSSFQLPTQFTENIMDKIMNSKPITPSVTKPLIPLAISAATAIVAALLIGVGAQNIFRYQQPYNIDRDSEATIEIIDAKLVIDTPIKPTLSQQNGNSIVADKHDSIGHSFNNSPVSASQIDETTVAPSKGKWIRAKGPHGGQIVGIFTSSQREVYVGTIHDLYRLSEDTNGWNLISSNVPFSGYWKLIEYNDKLYTVSNKHVYTSMDKGKTWNSLCVRPDGELIAFTITDEGFYLAISTGVFHSKNSGSTWIPLNEGLEEKEIKTLIAVDNHLFVGTDSGLFRLSSNKWEQVPVGKNIENIQALAYADQKLYVATGKNKRNQLISDFMAMMSTAKSNISLYRSTNLGDSWTNITPPKELMKKPRTTKSTFPNSSGIEPLPSIELVTYQNCLIMHAVSDSYFSNDGGENWSILDRSFTNVDSSPVTAILNENTIYCGGNEGVFRSTDSGNRWQEVSTGIVNKSIMDLLVSNDILYAYIDNGLVNSTDGGDTWHPLAGDI